MCPRQDGLISPRSTSLTAPAIPARANRANRKSRVVFITWIYSIDLKNALECTSARPHLIGNKADLLEKAPFVRPNRQLKETRMTIDNSRRNALVGFGALAVGAAALAADPSRAATRGSIAKARPQS